MSVALIGRAATAAVAILCAIGASPSLGQSADETQPAVNQPAPIKPRAAPKAKPAEPADSAAKPAQRQSKAKSKPIAKDPAGDEPSTAAKAPPDPPKPAEPKSVAIKSLPGPIVSLHNCAPVTSKVDVLQERYGKSVLFFVTCPAKERGGYQLQVVYVARDVRGTGARRVSFETPGLDGTMVSMDALPSAIPARETFVEKVEERDVVRSRNDPPWVTGAWRPEDREGVCAVVGHWRVQDAKAELWLWEEAKECPKDAAPKYEAKVDKKPPPLVAR